MLYYITDELNETSFKCTILSLNELSKKCCHRIDSTGLGPRLSLRRLPRRSMKRKQLHHNIKLHRMYVGALLESWSGGYWRRLKIKKS